MDEDGRRRPAPTAPPGDGAPAGRIAAVAARLDDRWDPAWDAAWWDPVWGAGRSVGATEPEVAAGKPAEAVAAQVGPAAVPQTPPGTAADPSWAQVLATTVGLWVSRRLPRAGLGRQDGRARFRGRGVSARLLAASMLGAGVLAVGAGTAGLLVAHGPAAAPARWAARPSPVPVPSGRAAAPVWLATVQQIARPVWLTIPAIGVRTRLVDLGLNRNGTLQVPASTTVAGWFTGSPRPGAVGSAVIAGHVDSRTGPAVFFWLRTMRPGERIYVGRADGTLAVFTVTSVRMYPKDNFPTAAVYGPVPDAELRLITCGGIFDEALGSYLSNVVVYARLTG
jgi:hypothetical protein